ncbi:MAG: hypothetical protein AMJ43_08680 [Coxiella sp. DG_40]|nr:MAG: hypothetical protein AMJ43_08680 [Coxiella sp. DG_40]
MFCNFRPIVLLCCGLYAVVIFGMVGACSPEHYKADADKEVYNIIDNKWQDSFGRKANYTISDVPPAPNDIQIEKEIPPSGVLSLAQAVATATAHNREYQKQKEDLYLAALDLTLERHNFARRWFGTIDAEYTKYTDQSGNNDEENITVNKEGTKLGFSQLLADGAIVSANIAIDWVRFLTGDPRTSLGSVLSASITQPLLRGAGRKIAQENLTQAERNALYQIRFFNRFREEFVVDVVAVYYGVLQRRDAVTNAENDYKRRIETKEMLEMKADAGRINRFQVDQAEQDVLRARDNYVRAQQRYEQLLDEFKLRLALPTDANIQLDQNELKALEKIGIDEPNYTADAAIETALVQRLDLVNSMDKIDDAARKIIVAADALRAGLNITGGLNIDSTEKTDFDRLRFHEGTYTLGLSGDLPLDRKAQRNAYREALISLEQNQRQYDNDRDKVKLEVRDAYRKLQEAAERYRIQKTSLQLAEKRVESTALLLEAGRAITRDWLEAQDALVEAQNNLTDALVAHAIAKLSFFRDVGILQVKPDGMWVQ